MIRRPLVTAATAFTLGALITPFFHWSLHLSLALVLSLVLFRLGRRRRIFGAILLPFPFAFAGVVAGVVRLPPAESLTQDPQTLSKEGMILEGFVGEAPRTEEKSYRLLLDVVGTATTPTAKALAARHGRVELRIGREADPGAPPCGQAGDRIRAWARLYEPRPALIPNVMSARARAAKRGVTLYASAPTPSHCLLVTPHERSGLFLVMARLRGLLGRRIGEILPERRAAMVRTFAIGDRTGVSKQVREAFRASGLSHLLAISGLHLAVVTGLFVVFLGWCFRWFPTITLGFGASRLAAVISIPIVILYTLLVGSSPSAVRAAIMVVALLSSQITRRLSEPWSALALAVLIMVALDPATLGDVSFQLSFAAVAALFRIYPALRARFQPQKRPWWGRWAIEIALVSVAATIGTAPLVARHFSRVSLIGFLANVPAAPIASLVVVPLSLVGSFLAMIHGGLGAPVLELAGASGDLLTSIATLAARIPAASVTIPKPTILECILFYGATIGLSTMPARRGARRFGLLCLALVLLSFGGSQLKRHLDSDLRVAFLPVGQGDATVVELGKGRVMVVDTGPGTGARDAAERVVAPYLRSRRITVIDVLVLTHPHEDHIGGFTTLVSSFPVREVWWNGDLREAELPLLDPLGQLNERILTASTAPSKIGETLVEVLAPSGPPRGYENVNDASLVLRLTREQHSVLLAGDLETDGEERLLATVGPGRVKAHVLKAGHHGSRTSSTERFLDAVSPRHVVFSVGHLNHFGFPHKEVMDRFRQKGVAMWRTDLDGLITVTTDGETLEVEPFRARTGPDSGGGR